MEKSALRELINLEFEIQADITRLETFEGTTSQIVDLNSQIKEKISKLQSKIKVTLCSMTNKEGCQNKCP